MIALILGLALWSGAHLFKRLAPGQRATMGDKGKTLVTIALLASVVLMVTGFRSAAFIEIWSPPAFLNHVNSLLMLLAFYLLVASVTKVSLTTKVRHPQLTAVKTWAIAHLLVNGDLASILLFGGMLAWAVVSVIVINRANRDWTRPGKASITKEIVTVVVTLVLVIVAMMAHGWLGVSLFG